MILPDLSPPMVAHPKLAGLLDLWLARFDGRNLPSRTAFSFEDFRPWMGNLGIIEVERPALRFRFRLYGVQLVEFDDQDFTGRYLDEVLPSERVQAILALYRRCVETGLPVHITGPSGRKDWLVMNRLLLPCATDGRTVDRIILGLYPENPDRQEGRTGLLGE